MEAQVVAMSLFALTLAASIPVACTPSVTGRDACRNDDDCIGGHVCSAGLCATVAFRDAAAVPDAGDAGITGLYDDFELPELRIPPWEAVQEIARLSIDDQWAYRGNRSLRVHFNGAPANEVVQGELTEIPFVPKEDLFARFFIYVPASVPMTTATRISGLIQDLQTQPKGFGLWLNDFNLEVDRPGYSDVVSTTALPLAAWTCLEWQVTTASAGAVRVWLNGTAVGDLDLVTDTRLDPPVGRFVVGFAYFGLHDALGAGDVWIDDVAVDTQRIGCDR
jgi:hypothetical protein